MSEASALHPLASPDPKTAELMGSAFEAAWAVLCSSGERLSAQEACDARIRLARVILEGVLNGERDVARLRELALASLDWPDGDHQPNSATVGLYL